MRFRRRAEAESGFSLVETLIASAILATALVSLAQLFGIATQANATAKNGGLAMILAEQKMEQLRGLTWGFDAVGLPLSDISTDTAKVPEAPTGGKGLSPSPQNTIQANTDGYVDYLDNAGRSLGGGAVVPMNTAYIRRWMVEPLPTNPNNTIVIQVLVTTVRREQSLSTPPSPRRRYADDALVASVRTRKSS